MAPVKGTGPAVPAESPDYGKGLATTRAKVSDAIPPITRRRLTLGLPARVIPTALFSIKSVIKNSKKADAANFGAAIIRFGRRVIGRAWMGAEIADVTLTV